MHFLLPQVEEDFVLIHGNEKAAQVLLVCIPAISGFDGGAGGSSVSRGDFDATCAASSSAKVSRACGTSEKWRAP
jgi:hypothetical protein